MELSQPQLIILAEVPDALGVLFGISLIERLLRVAQRLGFHHATILSSSPEEIRAHLAQPSWARAEIAVDIRPRTGDGLEIRDVSIGVDRILLVQGGFYIDARLLGAMANRTATTILVDSDPPTDCARLWQGRSEVHPSESPFAAALLDRGWLSQQEPDALVLDRLAADAASGGIELCDAAQEPTYVMSLRKHVRPVFFPAPSLDLVKVAEQFPRDVAQNGVLDLPGQLDSPIEDWIVARLCRTSIRPNQITFVTILIGLCVTALFGTGYLWWGVALAYVIEVLDGVDGKLARTKVETTAMGDWEHVTDYCVELSWWSALAYHFYSTGLPSAYWLLVLLVGSDLVDRLAKRVVKKRVGRNLDDVSNFDRFVRWIGGRRNINIWILIAALAFGAAVDGFVFFCWWGAATAAAHLVRAFQIRFRTACSFEVER
jgi:phosphatidylglycerophosphate synthase